MTLFLQNRSNGDLTPRDDARKAEISHIIGTFRKRQSLGAGVDAEVQLISDGTARLARKKVNDGVHSSPLPPVITALS